MNSYEAFNTAYGYDQKPAHTRLAFLRASQLPLNDEGITPSPASDLPPINPRFFASINRYPIYRLGYHRGDDEVYVPSRFADPAPIKDQVNHTSPHYYRSVFSGSDLPQEIFRIEPAVNDIDDVKVPTLCNAATGQPVITARGAMLRYFSFLPRYIKWDVSAALLEFWFRLDNRLEMNDIIMRIETDRAVWNHTDLERARNSQRMKRQRFRDGIVNANTWGDSRKFPINRDVAYVGKVTTLQICLNTCMIVDEEKQRLLKPIFSDETCSQHLGFIDSGLPLNYFLFGLSGPVPSKKMLASITLRHRLQELAIIKGKSNHPESWQYLDVNDEPPWWNDKKAGTMQQAGRRIHEIDGMTHREWMEDEFDGEKATQGLRVHAKTRGKTV